MSPLLAALREHKTAIAVSAAVNIGSILFGFDTGVAGGVVALASFKKEFLLEEAHNYTNASSNIVSILNLGAFLGALIPPFTSKFAGRKPLLGLAGFSFMLGGVLQTAASGPTLGMIYGGRIVSGLGVGIISNVAPVFVAECAPKDLRGILVNLSYSLLRTNYPETNMLNLRCRCLKCFLSVVVCLPTLVSPRSKCRPVSTDSCADPINPQWTTYGCSVHLPVANIQWRTPLSLQIILAAMVVLFSFAVPESPRWLAKQGRDDEAIQSLCRLRSTPPDSSKVLGEMAEIRAQIEEEVALTNGRTILELFERHNLVRIIWALGVGFFAMWSGHNAILYVSLFPVSCPFFLRLSGLT